MTELGLVALLLVVAALLWALWRRRGGDGDVLELRCTLCGNYYPSREHFAEDQVCRRCVARAGD